MEAPLQRMLAQASRVSGHAAKRAERKKVEQFKDQKWGYMYRTRMQNAEIKRIRKDAEKVRRDDWESGPRLLARRDVGKDRATFGTVPMDILYNPEVPEKWRKETWLAVGDRVVILTGADEGKIGELDDVNEETQSCRVKNLNYVSYVLPDFVAQENKIEAASTITGPRVLKWDDVKLIAPVKDKAGYFRDVVVDEIKLVRKFKNDKPRRIIPGLRTEIPWPEEIKPDHEDTESDTLRISVDELTFEPILNSMPMPGSAIDELRGKYSKFRTRHDPEYIAKKNAEAAALAAKTARLKEMGLTPFARMAARHNATPKLPPPELSEEQLRAIGEHMMKEAPELSARLLGEK